MNVTAGNQIVLTGRLAAAEPRARTGFFAALFLAGFFVMPVGPDFTHRAFLIEFLLQAAESTFDGLAFFEFYFGG